MSVKSLIPYFADASKSSNSKFSSTLENCHLETTSQHSSATSLSTCSCDSEYTDEEMECICETSSSYSQRELFAASFVDEIVNTAESINYIGNSIGCAPSESVSKSYVIYSEYCM